MSISPPAPVFPVFIKRGDALAEVERLVEELKRTSATPGVRKYFFVAKANQTVVMTEGRDTPLAEALRKRPGWTEPIENT